MKLELPVGQEALLSERGRLESLLAASEDWRALLQLKSRQERGEGLSAVNAARLEALLIDALAENPFYGRYAAVCASLGGRADNGVKSTAGSTEPEQTVDDLTRIRGIDAETARRLRALGVWTYAQVADWTSIDIHRVSAELGIGKLIHSQNWIEQAALLALANPRPPASATAPQKAATISQASPLGALPQLGRQQFMQPVSLPKQEPLPVPPVAARAALIEAVTRESPSRPAAVQPEQKIRAVAKEIAPAKPVEAPQPQIAEAPSPSATPAQTSQISPPAALAAVTMPTQPSALRVVTVATEVPPLVPVSAPLRERLAQATPTSDSVPAPSHSVRAAEVYPLREPPRPFVISRESLPPAPPPPPPTLPANATPSPQLVVVDVAPGAGKPAPIVIPPLPPTPLRVERPAAAAPASAAGVNAAPAMTISEAIAYAAAAARSSQRPPSHAPSSQTPVNTAMNGAHQPESQKTPQPASQQLAAQSASGPAAEAAKGIAEPPPIPSIVRVPGPPPNIPPPLPADFQPPEAKAEEPAPKARPVKFDTPRALTIDRDREDIGGFNAHVEEAIVEIVRKPSAASMAPAPPKAALAAAVAAAQAAQPAEGSRNATPIGRFLKALTGN